MLLYLFLLQAIPPVETPKVKKRKRKRRKKADNKDLAVPTNDNSTDPSVNLNTQGIITDQSGYPISHDTILGKSEDTTLYQSVLPESFLTESGRHNPDISQLNHSFDNASLHHSNPFSNESPAGAISNESRSGAISRTPVGLNDSTGVSMYGNPSSMFKAILASNFGSLDKSYHTLLIIIQSATSALLKLHFSTPLLQKMLHSTGTPTQMVSTPWPQLLLLQT